MNSANGFGIHTRHGAANGHHTRRSNITRGKNTRNKKEQRPALNSFPKKRSKGNAAQIFSHGGTGVKGSQRERQVEYSSPLSYAAAEKLLKQRSRLVKGP